MLQNDQTKRPITKRQCNKTPKATKRPKQQNAQLQNVQCLHFIRKKDRNVRFFLLQFLKVSFLEFRAAAIEVQIHFMYIFISKRRLCAVIAPSVFKLHLRDIKLNIFTLDILNFLFLSTAIATEHWRNDYISMAHF